MWNPNCDLWKLIDDFVKTYYGSAAQYIKDYLKLVHSNVKRETHLMPGVAYNNSFFDDELIYKSFRLFKKAKKQRIMMKYCIG